MDSLGPTAERLRHAVDFGDPVVTVPTERAGVVAHFVRVSDALDWYHAHCHIDDRQYEAGKRLRQAWHESGLEPIVTGSYQAAVDSGRDHERRLARGLDGRTQYTRLIRMVPVSCSWQVCTVCLGGERVGRGPPLARVRVGLDALAEGLGL